MGWWSAGIMGGDTPCDLEIEFYSLVGLEYEPTKKQIVEKFSDGQEQFIERIEEVLTKKWGIKREDKAYYEDYKSIAYQVLAVILINNGVTIDDKVRELMVEWIPKDEWSQTDHKRKEIIDNLLEKVKNSTPITNP